MWLLLLLLLLHGVVSLYWAVWPERVFVWARRIDVDDWCMSPDTWSAPAGTLSRCLGATSATFFLIAD